MTQLHQMTLSEQQSLLEKGECSSQEIVASTNQAIEAGNELLNAFIHWDQTHALEQAKKADQLIQSKQASALTGLPIAHKDIFCTQGMTTTCASKMLRNFVPPYNATVVEKLNAAGMVNMGKLNMDEFAMGSSNENSDFGPCLNPWDTSRVPGGSSGASAAAVAAGIIPAATGTDTGGSIRQPASFCGVTGIKPTYGRVSRWGIVAYASSLDQAGVLARTAQDCAKVLTVMSGFDDKDSTSVNQTVPDFSEQLMTPVNGLRIGLPDVWFGEGLDKNTEQLVQSALAQLESMGCTLVPVSMPHAHLAVPAYYVVASAECSSNLSRYDGVRYGYRCEAPQDLYDLYSRTRSEGFGEEVQRRILVGTYTLSAGYYDAYYLKAQKVRRLIASDFESAFKQVDILAGPTTPGTAFKVGEKTDDSVSMYLQDINTVAVNLAGLPGLSMPAGLAQGLPVGLQLVAPHFEEQRLLNLAHQFQLATDYHLQKPDFKTQESGK